MPLIHIDGLPGTGKTTVLRALEARGYAGVDVDDGLCVWVHKESGVVRPPDAFPGGRGADGYDWFVSRAALESLRDAAGETVVFVGGSIGNRSVVADCFARRIALVSEVEVLNVRLDARPEDAWGHDPQHREWLPDWYARFVADVDAEGAVVIRTDAGDVDDAVNAIREACSPQVVDADRATALFEAALIAARGEWAQARDGLTPDR